MSTTPPPPDEGQEPPRHDPGQAPPPPDARPSQPPQPDAEAATPPPAPPVSSDPGATRAPAGLGRRFGARLVDSLIVGIVMSILLAIVGVSFVGPVANAVIALVGFAYFVYLEGTRGMTLAKRLLGLQVERVGGGAMDFDAAARRNWWQLLGVLGVIPVLGVIAGLASLGIVIWIAVTISSAADKRGVHDGWGGTQVVRA